ncbi:alcohol dehydrogenase catalytic domain-containing protein [Verrucomicrobiaceae bacterium N1E253]|uniref:Alcohol dehydrogenase catalytic domain-containing protein n=1 Tax=Oceaniferula marina TaxID=2748318 RepID=A0A851G970_9BACT|nr:zinc-binding dehydrogenase [Oceaniferula marina]NWK54153.1 alcohol dehydrogenase catalytic domain-containing protein [Oceaniferula marina]
MKTQAAVAFEPGKPLEVLDIDIEGPKDGEVLVEMEACGICHTDAHSASGAEPWRKFPFVPGHEGCGIVREIGKGVTLLKPGDKVIPLYKSECGHCEPCTTGKSNNCDTIMPTQKLGVLMDGTSRFSYQGKEILHFMGCSAFSQWSVAPEISFAKIAPDAPSDEICLLGCAVTTGLGAVWKTAQVKPGSTVAVFGLGGIGLAAIQGAKIAGAKRIIAVDLNSGKFDLAKQFGATDVINPTQESTPAAEIITEMTQGGCDYTFEAAGAIPAMQSAIDASHPLWGTCCLLGNTPNEARISIHPTAVLGGRKILGCTFGGIQGRSELPAYVDKAITGELDLKPMVTHRLSLADINHGVDLMHAGKSIRSVITF